MRSFLQNGVGQALIGEESDWLGQLLNANILSCLIIQFLKQNRMQATEVCQAMVEFASKFKEIDYYPNLELSHFSDGIPFAIMLCTCSSMDLSLDELEQKNTKWIAKVGNLKKILTKAHTFLTAARERVDLIAEIDVVQIAKHASVTDLANFFMVVVSVLMNSQEKEKYIQMIMALKPQTQTTFVEIIRSSQHEESFSEAGKSEMGHLEEELKSTQRENFQLKQDISDLSKRNKNLQRELLNLKQKVANYEEEINQSKTMDQSINTDEMQSQIQQQRILIDNLKFKLLNTVRENQIEISQMRDQITNLQMKCENYEELETSLEQYRDLYNRSVIQLEKIADLEKDKRKLTRQLEDKDQMIKKLQEKIQENVEKHYSLQDNQMNLRMEIEKKEAKFKKLEKEVKTRLKSEPAEALPRFGDTQEDHRDEINYLEQELNKTKSALKEMEKENIRNRKKLSKMGQLQAEKKKMQKMVFEVNKTKDSEIEMLVITLFELKNENYRMFNMLKQASELKNKEKR